MIEPLLSDDAFLADVECARGGDGSVHLWWLGQSGYLLKFRSRYVLIDPYLSDSLTEKYANSAKPHVRMTRRVIDPKRLNFIDIVTSSHNHTDHLDPVTLQALARVNPKLKLIVSEANVGEARARSMLPREQIMGLRFQERIKVGQFSFRAIPAAHNQVEYDVDGHARCIGMQIFCSPQIIYHSGDTLRCKELIDSVSRSVDLALLPINGDNPTRGVAGNLNAHEAAQLAHDLQAKLVVPCHYEMFEFNTASPDEFRVACEAIKQPYRVLRAGERLTLKPEEDSASDEVLSRIKEHAKALQPFLDESLKKARNSGGDRSSK